LQGTFTSTWSNVIEPVRLLENWGALDAVKRISEWFPPTTGTEFAGGRSYPSMIFFSTWDLTICYYITR